MAPEVGTHSRKIQSAGFSLHKIVVNSKRAESSYRRRAGDGDIVEFAVRQRPLGIRYRVSLFDLAEEFWHGAMYFDNEVDALAMARRALFATV